MDQEQVISRADCSHWGRLEEGCRPVCSNGEWLYISESGVRLSNGTTWHHAGFFSNGYAVVSDDRGEFHIDRQNFAPIYAHRFRAVGLFCNDGRTWARTHSGEEVFINTAGDISYPETPQPFTLDVR